MVETVASVRWLQHRIVQIVAAGLVCLSVVTAVAAATVRLTVLRSDFYASAAQRSDLVERLYDDVLVDPELTRLHRDLSAGQHQAVRTAAAGLGVNIRLVLPPSVVRALLTEQIDTLVEWLRGDVTTLRLQISLRPIIDNLRGLSATYVSEVLAATPTLPTETLPQLRDRVGAAITAIKTGRLPDALPSLSAFRDDPAAVEAVLLSFVAPQLHSTLRPVIHTTLLSGDASDALAVVLEQAAAGAARLAGVDLIDLAGGPRVDLTSSLAAATPPSTVDTVRTLRWWLGTPLLVILVIAALLGLVGLAVLVVGGPGPLRRRAIRAGVVLAAGGVLSAMLGVVAWLWLGSVTSDVGQVTWPPSVRTLAQDNIDAVRSALLQTWLRCTAVALIAGIGVVVGQSSVRAARVFAGRRVVLGVAALGVIMVAVGLVPAAAHVAQRCNGATYLCDRRYDQVVALATHNAMANTQDRFLFPLQDPDIDTQLDAGARALQLDSWTWETPDQVAGRLASSEFPPRTVAAVRRFAEVANPPRPGTWLCHAVCRIGATPAVAGFVALREWLDRNPREVVTVILQDETPAARSVAAVREAGLVPYLAEPPKDPAHRWPTLRQMISAGHRLVMFTENARNAAPWLQNFYDYGEETPFSFSSFESMAGPASCVANRGGSGRRLFLLNHFVTPASGSRQQSALANSADFLTARIRECATVRDRLPTVIAVDFASLGQAQEVVDRLNRVGISKR